MNPLLASPRLDVSARRDVELLHLEELFADDCKCETDHVVLPCTFKVVALLTSRCKTGGIFKCSNAVRYSEHVMLTGIVCVDCDELASECWTIRPI